MKTGLLNGARLGALLLYGALAAGCAETPAPEEPAPAPAPGRPTPPVAGGDAGGSWPQWGGPNGDFRVPDAGLARSWPAEGPSRLWERPLGAGYSAIAAADGKLYTLYREDGHDVAVALDADSGERLWEHRYEAPVRDSNAVQFGEGPNATPLVLDDRIVTLGYTGILKCLAADTGDVIWETDLVDDHGGEVLNFGNSASPISHDGKVIVLVGGESAVVAFDPRDGSVAWRSRDGSVSYSTPRVLQIAGVEQLVYYAADAIVGLSAADGSFIWTYPVLNQYENNASNLLWSEPFLWVATQLDGGTRVLRLTAGDPGTVVEEVWSSNKMSIHFWNAVLVDRHVYASIGSNASILAAIELETGEFEWRERGFEQVNFVVVGERAILLDGDGQLALASLRPEGLEIHAQARVFDEATWTVPTVVGTRLFVRDKRRIYAFDLS